MLKAFRPTFGVYVLICIAGWAQKGNSPPRKPTSGINTESLRAGSIIRYGQRRWKLVKQLKATFNWLPDASNILLLESLKPTSAGGAGQELSDVELVILYGGTVIYDCVKEGIKLPEYKETRFYMDDYLELKDLSHVAIPEALFHSGSEGASDPITLVHILYYDKLSNSFADIALPSFYNSGRHGFRWLSRGARTFAVTADENWSADNARRSPLPLLSEPFSI